MRIWKFEENIEVYEIPYNNSLHAFAVWAGDDFLGSIYPDNVVDMQECITALDDGSNPIRDGWDDGLGNTCNENGWNLDYLIDAEKAFETWKEAVSAFEDYKEQVTGWEPNYYVRSGVYRGTRVWQLSDQEGIKIDKESLHINPKNYWENSWDEPVEVDICKDIIKRKIPVKQIRPQKPLTKKAKTR